MIIDTLKAVALILIIATVSVAIVVFGVFIGGILLFLGAVAIVALILLVLWKSIQEERKRREG